MSFLPYGGAASSGWFSAFGGSAVLHGAAIFGMASIAVGAGTVTIVPTRASFTVTLEQLDADTLAGLIEQDGVAGSLGETGGETADPGLAVEGDGVIPDPVQTAPEGATLEMPLERPASIQPDTLPPVVAQSEVIAPSPIVPQAITPLTTAATLVPVTGMEELTSLSASNTFASVDGDPIVTSIVPSSLIDNGTQNANTNTTPFPTDTATIPATPTEPPTAQDLAVSELIERIRAAPPQSCLIALPRRDGTDGIGLAMIAALDSAMEQFAQTVLTAQDSDIRQTRTLIDPRQCPALAFVARNAAYPAMRLGIQTNSTEVASGGTITGALRGVGGRYLALVMIDDNGVVIDLQRFVTYAGNVARFDIPVTRVGVSRDTRPVILAIATDRPVTPLTQQFGRLARDVFVNALNTEFRDAHLGLVSVDIR